MSNDLDAGHVTTKDLGLDPVDAYEDPVASAEGPIREGTMEIRFESPDAVFAWLGPSCLPLSIFLVVALMHPWWPSPHRTTSPAILRVPASTIHRLSRKRLC